jgi:hypothetical protein
VLSTHDMLLRSEANLETTRLMSTHLVFEHVGDHVTKRHLGTTGDTLVLNLEGNHGVERGLRGSHDNNSIGMAVSWEGPRWRALARWNDARAEGHPPTGSGDELSVRR